MPELGWAEFAQPYLFDQIYLNGSWVPQRPVLRQEPFEESCWALPTAAGTHIFQREFRGDDAPKDKRALRFSFDVQADTDLAWWALKEAKGTCAPFYFATGVRQTDTFAATSGSTYRLTSPIAAGIVPGVTTVTHPHVIKLDGVVDPSAATISGQTLTANATGTIIVQYTPVHWVRIAQFPEEIAQHNDAVIAVVLEELLVA